MIGTERECKSWRKELKVDARQKTNKGCEVKGCMGRG
jgi:hypothetical protein